MRRKFTNPFGFVHSSDMIGRYTHTRKQANLFFPLFSFFFLFYTNRTGLPHTRQAGSVLSVRFIMRRLQQATANPKTFRRIRTAPRRGRRLCRPDKCCGFAEDIRENAAFCGRTEASAPTRIAAVQSYPALRSGARGLREGFCRSAGRSRRRCGRGVRHRRGSASTAARRLRNRWRTAP